MDKSLENMGMPEALRLCFLTIGLEEILRENVCHNAKSLLRVRFRSVYPRNSDRVLGSVLKDPPSDVVLVEELVSITPRDFTQ